MKGIPGKEYEPTCPGCGHPVSEHRYNFICQHEGCYCSLTPADLQPKVEPVEKRYMVIVEGKQTPHYVHTNLKHAKNEAERLCTKEQRKTQVIEVIPIGHWETSHLSIWHEEQ